MSYREQPRGHEEVSSFASFWKNTTKKAIAKPLTFIRHGLKGAGRETSPSSTPLSEVTHLFSKKEHVSVDGMMKGQTPHGGVSKRRQQIFQAQKLHRERKTDYVKSLEQEAAHLRQIGASTREEKTKLEAQNAAMRRVLASMKIGLPPSQVIGNAPDVVVPDSASANVCYDTVVRAERIFVELSQRYGQRLPDATKNHNAPFDPAVLTRERVEDASVILDFIFALEHPCKDHISHPSIVQQSQSATENGHMLMLSSHVYMYASPETVLVPDAHWHIPYAEIEKLVQLSEGMDLQGEITPVQAWQHLKAHMGPRALSEEVLRELKNKLGRVVTCYGFGAVLELTRFWDTVNDVLKTAAPFHSEI